MMSAWMFFFGCVLCLMFLGMLYGERFSLLGLFDGRWMAPVARIFGDAWTELARGLDDVFEFVTSNASWVTAAASGTVGLSIVAFLMFSGLANDAGAVHLDESIPLQRGGVLDAVPEIAARVSDVPIRLASARTDDSNLVLQEPGGIYAIFSPPRPRDEEQFLPPLLQNERRTWDLARPELLLSLDRTRLQLPIEEDDTVTVTRGRLIETPPVSLLRLRDSGWRLTLSSFPNRDPLTTGIAQQRTPLPESSVTDQQELESRVRIHEGNAVAAQDLRIEKSWPRATASGEIELVITVLNVGDSVVNGVLVREILPWQTEVLDIQPNAVIRDSVVTWLIDELPPFEEQLLRCTVRPPAEQLAAEGVFDSQTEVSATTSATSPIVVTSARPPARQFSIPDFPPPARVPEAVRRPEVRLQIEEPASTVVVNDTIEVYFNVSNVGDAPAEGVRLRVTLDQGLDHHTLEDDDIQRRVENGIRRIEAGDTRRIVLRMRATQPGQHFATAEMIFEGAQLSLSTFQIYATEPDREVPGFSIDP
jgi:hypothetical protein